MGNVLVSVIVPIYKAEKCLNKCLDSIISQTEKNIEILLIDDGSPDRSGAIADDYARRDNRVNVVHLKNSGVASARNTGLKMAVGKYVAFVDSDDWVDPEFISSLLSAKSDVDIVRCNVCYEYSEGSSQIKEDHFEHGFYIAQKDFSKHIYSKMIDGMKMNSIWRTLFKREVINGLYFNENLPTIEDLVFCIEAYTRAKDFLYVSVPYYHYFQNQEGLTGSGLSNFTKLRCNFYASKVLIEYLPKWGMNTFKNNFLCFKRVFNMVMSKIRRVKYNSQF